MIFPEDFDETEDVGEATAEDDVVLPQDWAVDFATGEMILDNGRPRIVTGIDALKVWIYKTLRTERGAYIAYSGNIGVELERLIGSSDFPYIRAQIEAQVSEALTANPFVLSVGGFEFSLKNGTHTAFFDVETTFGTMREEMSMNI